MGNSVGFWMVTVNDDLDDPEDLRRLDPTVIDNPGLVDFNEAARERFRRDVLQWNMLSREDMMLGLRVHTSPFAEFSEIGSLVDLDWYQCTTCGSSLATIGKPPTGCANGHVGDLELQHPRDEQRFAAAADAAIRTWTSKLTQEVEQRVVDKLAPLFGADTCSPDFQAVVDEVSEAIKVDMANSWPTGELQRTAMAISDQDNRYLGPLDRLIHHNVLVTLRSTQPPKEGRMSHELTLIASNETLTLYIESVPTEAELAELQEWAAFEFATDDDTDRGSLRDAIELSALSVAVLDGVIGNAAYDLFPLAASFPRDKFRKRGRVLDADAVARRALDFVEHHHAVHGATPHLHSIDRRGDGLWDVVVQIDGHGAQLYLVIASNGMAISSKPVDN